MGCGRTRITRSRLITGLPPCGGHPPGASSHISSPTSTIQTRGSTMLDKPTIVQTTAQKAAVIHLTIPRSKIQEEMGPGYNELMSALKEQGITPTGPWFSHHLRMDPAVFDFEIGVPVATDV